MCGFFGYLAHDILPDISRLHNCGALIKYRGPNESSFLEIENYYFQFHRLAILDTSMTSRQPLITRSGWILGFNGFIDNYRELIKKYHLKVAADSDTQMICELFELRGLLGLKELSGMFAISLYHPKTKELHLLRDPFATKPLFYTETREALIYSSEIKTLLPWINNEMHPQALWDYFSFNYIPRNNSIFKNIAQVPAGAHLKFLEGKLQEENKGFYKKHYFSKKTEGDAFHHVMTETIEKYMRADTPIGVMLSGGLDSSALAAFAVREQPKISTWSLAFDAKSFDESKISRETAKLLGTDHHEILVTPKNILENLSSMVDHISEPYGDGSAIPTYLLAKAAKSKVDVLLSGEGGDEALAGYDTYRAFLYAQLFKSYPAKVILSGASSLARLFPTSYKKLSFEFKLKRFLAGAHLPVSESHFFWRHVLLEQSKTDLFQPDFFEEKLLQSQDLFPSAHSLNDLMAIDRDFHLAQDLMIKNDRMTMAHGIEARVPFLSTDFLKWADGLPRKDKLSLSRSKIILREKLKNRLPDSVINGKKIGLELPYGEWFRREWKEPCFWIIKNNPAVTSGILQKRFLEKAWEQHQNGLQDHGRFLYGLLIFSQWYLDIYSNKLIFKENPVKPRLFQVPYSL